MGQPQGGLACFQGHWDCGRGMERLPQPDWDPGVPAPVRVLSAAPCCPSPLGRRLDSGRSPLVWCQDPLPQGGGPRVPCPLLCPPAGPWETRLLLPGLR